MDCVPARDEFHALAQRASVVPVYREMIADGDTPVSALAKLGAGPASFLLESVEGGERLGRYSFLGSGVGRTFSATGDVVTVVDEDGSVRTERCADPFRVLEDMLADWKPAHVPGLSRFFGGAVGFVGFDGVAVPGFSAGAKEDERELPDMVFLIANEMIVFDHVRRVIQVVVNAKIAGDADAAYDRAQKRIDDIVRRLQKETGLRPLRLQRKRPSTESDSTNGPLRVNVSPAAFYEAVRSARDKVRRGDAYQIVLSLRMSSPLKSDPFDVYRLLRSVNPSPYMFYMHFGSLQLVGSSPEVMVRLEDGEALLRPIAGTRPRGKDRKEDAALASALLADEKERAEHVMLVDLGRSDLGKVCRPGTVRVDEWMTVEKYSHVMHIVSNVRGELAPGRSAFDLLKATFPAGTVSGVPKAAALQAIADLEPTPRGPYGGAVGYIGFNGNMDSCIAIRTVVIFDGEARVQAGAGIVADSEPQKEYEEIHDKARALLQTIALAEEVST